MTDRPTDSADRAEKEDARIDSYRTYRGGCGLEAWLHGATDGSIPGPDRDYPAYGEILIYSWHQIVGTCSHYSRSTFRGEVVAHLLAKRG